MATIHVRDIPEDSYEVLRRRARQEGRSIQSYMRRLVIEAASRPTKDETAAARDEALATHGPLRATPEEVVALVRDGRR